MMTDLLIVTLGPVQDFIAAARRTRDLWFGSHILSEVSRAAAKALTEIDAELVFPALEKDDPELEMCRGPLRETEKPPLAVANKIIAKVSNGEKAARRARDAANAAWCTFATWARGQCKGLLAQGINDVWDEQVDTFLEFQAAWLPLESDDKYEEVRRSLERAIAGRKQLRDFSPWSHQRGNVPKSSLDGARETVLAAPYHRAAHLVRRYRIAGGEQLDAVGLVKRAGGKPEQFVPIANIALAGWIEHAKLVAEKKLSKLATACKDLDLGQVQRPDLKWTRAFPHDAMVFFPDRWPSILKEAEFNGNAQNWGNDFVRPLFRKNGQEPALPIPSPYVACLVADGDRIGDVLSKLDSSDKQRTFAKALSHFAGRAREIVEQEHRGALVYGGGDDVLAFVCLDDALQCADALQKTFAEFAERALRSVGIAGAPGPTLSVGIGIGHVMESMGHLLDLGRRAEKRAKDPEKDEGDERNALAVLVDKRSGGEIVWRGRWDHKDQGPLERIALDRRLLQNRLSMTKVHEIHGDVCRLPKADDLMDAEGREFAQLLVHDVTRTLARTNDGEGVSLAEAGLDLDVSVGYASLRRRVAQWVDRLLCARMFDEASRGGRF